MREAIDMPFRSFYWGTPAVSPKKLIQNAFPVNKRNAKFVAPARVELTKKGYCVYTITKVPGERPRAHKVLIHMKPGYQGAFNRCSEIKIDCNCKNYLYVWNYALDDNANAIINRTNYEPPIIRNPEEIPGICVDSNSWVYTEFGSKRLKDIVVGDRVRTLNGLRVVTETRNMGTKPVLSITTESGKNLVTTEDHKILVASAQGIHWKRADAIKSGDRLISSAHDTRRYWPELNPDPIETLSTWSISPGNIPTRLTPDVAEFLGLFVAEGFGNSGGGASISQEPITRTRILELSNKLWSKPSASPLNLGAEVSRTLEQWGIKFGSHHQSIPDCILQSSNDILAAFIKGYYAGNGWFATHGGTSIAGTRSETLRDDLLYALGRLGVQARSTVNYSGVNKTRIHLIRTSNPVSTGLAVELFLREDISFERVEKVSVAKPRNVHDISVDGTPHFFANGFCVHNCKHGIISLKFLLTANPRWKPPAQPSAKEQSASRKPIKLTELRDALNLIHGRKPGA